jgi:hypothetical protein
LVIQIEAYPKYSNASLKVSVVDLVNQYFTIGNGNYDISDAFNDDDLRFNIKSLGGIKKISITCTDTIASNEYMTLGSATVNVTGGI